MYYDLRLKVNVMRTCFLMLLLLLLAGCGPVGCGSDSSLNRKPVQTPTPLPTTMLTPTVTSGPSATPTATSSQSTISAARNRSSATPTATSRPNPAPTATTVPNASLASPLHDAPISASIPVPGNAHGLKIYSVEGLLCPIKSLPKVEGPADNLVLATDRLTYSADEIQVMRNYLTKLYSNTASLSTSYLVPPPSTLKWVPGAPSGGCGLNLQVSNIGTTTVQIPSLGVQLTGTPQPNTYTYRAIHACSVAQVDCNGHGGNGGPCSGYIAEVSLNPGAAAGAVFAEQPQQHAVPGWTCPEPTLQPGDTLHFHLFLDSPGPQPSSTAPYIYAVQPILTVTGANESITSTVPAMAATIAFTDQISSYGLHQSQDTTFVLCPNLFVC